jgi:hypothetical protein
VSQRRSSPTGFFRPGRRSVETSGDVIGFIMKPLPNECRAFYGLGRDLIYAANVIRGKSSRCRPVADSAAKTRSKLSPLRPRHAAQKVFPDFVDAGSGTQRRDTAKTATRRNNYGTKRARKRKRARIAADSSEGSAPLSQHSEKSGASLHMTRTLPAVSGRKITP